MQEDIETPSRNGNTVHVRIHGPVHGLGRLQHVPVLRVRPSPRNNPTAPTVTYLWPTNRAFESERLGTHISCAMRTP